MLAILSSNYKTRKFLFIIGAQQYYDIDKIDKVEKVEKYRGSSLKVKGPIFRLTPYLLTH